MTDLNLENFDPTVADLQQLVGITSQVDVADLAAVKTGRIMLRDARVKIAKRGKELREDALAFQKAVIAKEKELIAIIMPEENRLATVEASAAEAKRKADLLAILPQRKEKTAELGIFISDEVLLELTDAQFYSLCNTKVEEKNAKAAEELTVREKELREKEEKLEREEETRLREQKARDDERAKIENDAKLKKEADRAEKERLAKREDFIAYLKTLGWTEETKANFLLNHMPDGSVKVYSLLGTYVETK